MRAWRLQLQRARLRRRVRDNALAALLATPLPDRATPFDEAEFVCLDIETTGLDAASAEMLSVGWVLIRHARVELDTAESHLVRPDGEVGDSATVHGLTDTMCESGDALTGVLEAVLGALAGRSLVVHHAGLDKALLDRLCVKHFGGLLPVPVVDTLRLEHRRRVRQHHVESRQSLRLMDLRGAYGLPHYAAHDCVVDAIATAELLLAMVATHGGKSGVTLGDLTA